MIEVLSYAAGQLDGLQIILIWLDYLSGLSLFFI